MSRRCIENDLLRSACSPYYYLMLIIPSKRNNPGKSLGSILRTMCDEYGYTQERANAFHADMIIYAYGLTLGMNAGFLNMTEPEIAERFRIEFIALSAVHDVPNQRNGNEKG